MAAKDLILYVQDFLIKQGKPSVGEHFRCYYRHPDDNNVRCAVGCLLPDNFYESKFEGMSVSYLLQQNKEFFTYLANKFDVEDPLILLAKLQFIHDSWREKHMNITFQEYIVEEFQKVLKNYE